MLLKHFAKYYSRPAKPIVFHEIGIPLATASITGHRMGSCYGLDVTPARFMTDALRMKTPVERVYLNGQHIVTPVIPGTFWDGFLCAGSIEPNVF